MTDIKKLLSKKGWTGKELGQIALANLSHKFAQQIQGVEPTPLVTHGEFSKMLNTLKDPNQINAYNGYVKIHEWITNVYNITSGQEQQAQSNYKTLLQRITTAEATEQAYRYISRLPVIMTEKQYNDFVEARKAEILEPDGEAMSFNLFNALIEATESLVRQLEEEPEKPNPLAGLKETLEHEEVTDPRILSRYNEVTHRGYYTIDETGERSDNMTSEEWAKALETEYSLEAEEATKTGDTPARVYERVTAVARATFAGKSDEEIADIEGEYNLLKKCTFHLYEEPPADLNKWEVLETENLLFECYRSLEVLTPDGEKIETDEEYAQATAEDIEAFRSEYPTVFEAVKEDMRKYIGDVADTPIEEWATTMFSWADLHKAGFYDFDKNYLDDIAIFKGDRRLANGVAILRPCDSLQRSLRIDEQGYYNPPNILEGLASLSINALFPEDPDYTFNVEEIEDARKTLLDSYYVMLGFNKAIELIAEHFDVPQIEVFKFDTASLARRMGAFNDLVAYLYKEIKDTHYEDKDLQAKKLEALQDYFYPIEYEELEIPQENIDRVIELFRGYKAFEEQNITSLLCIRPNAYNGIV